MMTTVDDMEGLTCPITHALMVDPVVDPEGNCYDRVAIEQWLDAHGVSPITRTPMTVASLVPNRALKDLIDGLNKPYGNQVESVAKPDTTRVDQATAAKREEIDGRVTLTTEVSTENETDGMMMDVVVHINTPNPTAQEMGSTACDVVCCVDVSGSMATEAEVQNDSGQTESHGLTLLDIVKHALTTIIHSLSADSRLAIVSFSSSAYTWLPLTAMDTAGTELALAKVARLSPHGCTNLWAGLDSSIHQLRTREDVSRCASIMLLTDGVPSNTPMRGFVGTLKHKYLSDPTIPLGCQINTFGFGYNVQSDLLRDLAEAGTGTYSFIPDSGMCGTVFINTLANTLSTLAIDCTVTVEANRDIGALGWESGVQIKEADEPKCATVHLGSLHYGQSNDVVFRLKRSESTWLEGEDNVVLNAKLVFHTRHHVAQDDQKTGWLRQERTAEKTIDASLPVDDEGVRPHVCRAQLVSTMRNSSTSREGASQQHRNLTPVTTDELRAWTDALNEFLDRYRSEMTKPAYKALFEDAEGQVTLAFSKAEWYKKWGKHYILSLARSHQLQQCTNFKDESLQSYGKGALFCHIQDIADDLFNSLPAPKPSRPSYTHHGSQASAQPVNMNVYNNRSAPCFSGDSLVHMADGTKQRVDEVRKGSVVMTANGESAKIVCVLKTNLDVTQPSLMVTLPNGLCVTPWHPIVQKYIWKFPADVYVPVSVHLAAVYSFVLEEPTINTTMVINNTTCICLGHGRSDNSVVSHPYFGSEAILNDMQKDSAGWAKGLVCIDKAIRDDESGLICGLQFTSARARSIVDTNCAQHSQSLGARTTDSVRSIPLC